MSLDLVASREPREQQPAASVIGRLNYIEPNGVRPFAAYTDAPGGAFETNAIYAPHDVVVHNARSSKLDFSLDVQGFELVRHKSGVRDFRNEAEALALGRTEAARLVQSATGASRVVVFDHTVRQRTPAAPRQPSIRVHNDYTETSAPARVRDLLGAEAEALLQKRVAFINVWRPILHAAEDHPLVLADARSVSPADFIATDVIYSSRRGEIYALAHHPAHLWFYYPSMSTDEAILLKCYDSRRDVARFVPHTAFDDPNTPTTAPPRASIEFRAIAFY